MVLKTTDLPCPKYFPTVVTVAMVFDPKRWSGPRAARITGVNTTDAEFGVNLESVNVSVFLDPVKDHAIISKSIPQIGNEGCGTPHIRVYSNVPVVERLEPAQRPLDGLWCEIPRRIVPADDGGPANAVIGSDQDVSEPVDPQDPMSNSDSDADSDAEFGPDSGDDGEIECEVIEAPVLRKIYVCDPWSKTGRSDGQEVIKIRANFDDGSFIFRRAGIVPSEESLRADREQSALNKLLKTLRDMGVAGVPDSFMVEDLPLHFEVKTESC